MIRATPSSPEMATMARVESMFRGSSAVIRQRDGGPPPGSTVDAR
jgi:hypothetical protein